MSRVVRRRGSHMGTVWVLVCAALGIYVGGSFYLLSQNTEGRIRLARHGIVFSKSEVRAALSIAVRSTFRRLGVNTGAQDVRVRDEAEESVVEWTARLPARASLTQTNLALTDAVEKRGGRVFDAWEAHDAAGTTVHLLLGVGRLVTHEVRLVRAAEGEGAGTVLLAIVLEGFAREGADSLARLALEADFEFSGAVLTNAADASAWARDLAKAQREVVALVPMEPMNYPASNPGQYAIRVDMTPNQVRRLVRRHLDRARDPVAFLPYMGGMALRDSRVMSAVCEELKSRPVAYLEPPAMDESRGLDEAARGGVPFLRLDQRISAAGKPDAWEKELPKRLADLTDTARRRGYAAAALPLDGGTLRILAREAPRWERQGVQLVPLSAVLRPTGA